MKVLPCTVLFLLCLSVGATMYKDLQITSVNREIDLTTQNARHFVELTVANSGGKATSEFFLALSDSSASRLSYMEVWDENEQPLTVSAEGKHTKGPMSYTLYKAELPNPLAQKATIDIRVRYVFTHSMEAYPRRITQEQPQFVKYEENHFLLSPYPVVMQITSVQLPSMAIESRSEEAPTQVKEDSIIYGPYQDVAPLSSSPMYIHFENNSPFVTISQLEKLVEVSHWGNIAVEEAYKVRHDGAELSGSFSRLLFQRNPAVAGISAVTSLKQYLPKQAKDVYYRDEIGNISTSHVFPDSSRVSFELLPRFPLFGGWKTDFYTGYNLPLPHFLYNDNAGRFVLNLSFVEDWETPVVIDDYTVRIVLPQGASDVKVETPFEVDYQAQKVGEAGYLDTAGRTLVVIKKANVVTDHNQSFQVSYNHSTVSLLRKPVLLAASVFLLHVIFMVYARFSFSISEDDGDDTDAKVVGLLLHLQKTQKRRNQAHTNMLSASSKYLKEKDMDKYKKDKKDAKQGMSECTNVVQKIASELDECDPGVARSVREIEKQETVRAFYLDRLTRLDIESSQDKITKNHYEKSKKEITKLYSEVDEEIQRMLALLTEDI